MQLTSTEMLHCWQTVVETVTDSTWRRLESSVADKSVETGVLICQLLVTSSCSDTHIGQI